MTRPPAGSTDLSFQAPPSPPAEPVDDAAESVPPPAVRATGYRPSGAAGPSGGRAPHGELRMLKGAREAAAGMRISDDQIRAVLEDPQDVQPDAKRPERTHLRRDGVTVTTGADGMILRVTRRR